ncbi:MAG TPA: hypothetical protein VE008_07410 [Burkholderiales bacterium]|nr:hypothetical protein [Burkholderiales bacterium]
MTPVLNLVNTMLLASSIGATVLMFDHMNAKTRHSVRCGVLLLFIGAIAEVIGVWRNWQGWTDALFFGGVSMFLVANVRAPKTRDEDELSPAELEARRRLQERIEVISNRGAFAIFGVTLAAVLVTWTS